MENDPDLRMSDSERIAVRLNNLLANYSIFYQNARGFHWRISGGKSPELCQKLEELYTNLQEKIDAVANRILALGHEPESVYSKYIVLSVIPESKKIWEEEEAIANILESYSIITAMQKIIVEKAAELEDLETVALITGFIEYQEKQLDTYTPFLDK